MNLIESVISTLRKEIRLSHSLGLSLNRKRRMRNEEHLEVS